MWGSENWLWSLRASRTGPGLFCLVWFVFSVFCFFVFLDCFAMLGFGWHQQTRFIFPSQVSALCSTLPFWLQARPQACSGQWDAETWCKLRPWQPRCVSALSLPLCCHCERLAWLLAVWQKDQMARTVDQIDQSDSGWVSHSQMHEGAQPHLPEPCTLPGE